MEDSGLAGSTGGRSTATLAPVAYERADTSKTPSQIEQTKPEHPSSRSLGEGRQSNHTKLPHPKVLLQQVAVAHVDRVRALHQFPPPRRELRRIHKLVPPLARGEAAVP